MGRGATKAAGNVWYEARMEAAKWNDKLLSRAGAAEALNMSEDAVKDAELGLNKCMPVDKAVLSCIPSRTAISTLKSNRKNANEPIWRLQCSTS